jgi:hypothetical protein
MRPGDDNRTVPGGGPRGADDVTVAVRLRAAEAHRRALRLLEDTVELVREQRRLERDLAVAVGDDSGWAYDVGREASGLVALDSVLGNAAAEIAEAGGGLWCGGPPRPWPTVHDQAGAPSPN